LGLIGRGEIGVKKET